MTLLSEKSSISRAPAREGKSSFAVVDNMTPLYTFALPIVASSDSRIGRIRQDFERIVIRKGLLRRVH